MPTKKAKPAKSKAIPRAKAKARHPAGFDLKKFCEHIKVPLAEQKTVAKCLQRGLESYNCHVYGKEHEPSKGGLREWMHQPFVFGFGAVAIAREEALSVETRLRVVDCALRQIDVEAEYGTPHGLPAVLSFLARIGRLEPTLFRSVMIAADFEGALFDDWPLEEAHQLLDWGLEKADIPEQEKLWWVWYISLHGEPPQICKNVAETLLAHGALTPAQKRALCQAWLTETPVGEPPPQWQAMQALLRGDVEAFAQYAAKAGMPVPEKLPAAADLEAGYDSALEALLGEDDGVEPPPLSFTMLRRMLVGPMGILPLTPSVFKREALFALPGLGEDPLALCKKYLDSARGEYYADAVNEGVADVLSAYSQQMPPAEMSALVERGLAIGSVPSRKAFYQAGADLFGDDYLARAAKDPAKSIRDWAAKKLPSVPPKRARKPRSKQA